MNEWECSRCKGIFHHKPVYLVQGGSKLCHRCSDIVSSVDSDRTQRIEEMAIKVMENFDREGYTTANQVSDWIVDVAVQIIDKIDAQKRG